MIIFKSHKKYKELNIILEWIKGAKREYIEKRLEGMCISFSFASKGVKLKGRDKRSTHIAMWDIHKFIPEFNPKFLDATCVNPHNIEHSYWWPINDRESRIKAFDKLIALYTTKLSE